MKLFTITATVRSHHISICNGVLKCVKMIAFFCFAYNDTNLECLKRVSALFNNNERTCLFCDNADVCNYVWVLLLCAYFSI